MHRARRQKLFGSPWAATAVFALALLIPAPCQAWSAAHRYIRSWAVARLPQEQAAFVGASALTTLHEKYSSLQDTNAGGTSPQLDPYCTVPGVQVSLHDVNPPEPTRAGMEWYFQRIVEHLRAGREDAGRRDEAMKYLGVLCHWCEDPGSLSAHSSPVSEVVLRQLIPPPVEMENKHYTFGYCWIGLEENIGLDDTDYRPRLIGGTVRQAAARLTHLQQQAQRQAAGLIVPAILGKVENDTRRFQAAVGKAVRSSAELTADVIYTAVFLAMQDEAAGEPPVAAHLRELPLTAFVPDTTPERSVHPYRVIPFLVNQSLDEGRDLHPLAIDDHGQTRQPVTGYGMGVPYTLPFTLALGGEYHEFRTQVGLTPQAGEHASVTFEVLIDGQPAAKAGPIRRGDAAQQLRVELPEKPGFTLALRTTTDNARHPSHNVAAWGDPTLVRRAAPAGADPGGEPVDIGSRLELFVDGYLVAGFQGDARLHLHKPEPREVVLSADAPWEGNASGYFRLFQDGDLYRMYYRGAAYTADHHRLTHEVTCYAESRDGLHWTKPELGLIEFGGSKANNIVWDRVGAHNFTPFKDAKPDCPPEARYKALGSTDKLPGVQLFGFQSADGLRWRLVQDAPLIARGAFDSQNLAFWDPVRKCYAEYHRDFRKGWPHGERDIMTCTSTDFLHWTEPEWLEYPGVELEHLYTNAIQPYERAPHILIGFPTRFLPKTSQTEPTFMAGRDGRTFHRWTEAIIPLDAPEDRDGNRSNYMAAGLLRLPGNDRELSVYATEANLIGPAGRLRRFTYRVDGFVSARAGAAGGELVTRPVTFAGRELVVNFATGEGGNMRVEIQDAAGKPIDGFGLADCTPLTGDQIEHAVRWRKGGDVSRLAGRPVRLRFVLCKADLYSFRFRDGP